MPRTAAPVWYLLFRASDFSIPEDVEKQDEDGDTHPPMRARIEEMRDEIIARTPVNQLPPLVAYLGDFTVICDEIDRLLGEIPPVRWPKWEPN